MTTHRHFLKSGAVLGLGQVLSQGLLLLRNMIVARTLSPADMGVAATFALTISLLEMTSDLNVGLLLIQSPQGDDKKFLDSTHLLNAARGLILSLLLFALAWPFSTLFNVPQALWAFQCLALAPLVRGLVHNDLKRLQRHMRFGPNVLAEIISQLAATAAAWPMAAWLNDYSAMLWLVMLQSVVHVAISHLTAQRPYRWAWHKAYAGKMFSFGLPLLLNGGLMFFMFQGDRMIVGSVFTMADLGPYSLALNLAIMASSILMTVLGTLWFPVLAKAHDSPQLFNRYFSASMQVYALSGAALGILFTLTGGWIISLLYGPKYAAAGLYIGSMGAAQAIRLIRACPITAGLALADPYNSLLSNLCTLTGPLAALTVALMGYNLQVIAMTGILGESTGLIAGMVQLQLTQSKTVSAATGMKPLIIGLGGIAASVLLVLAGVKDYGRLAVAASAIALIATTITIMYLLLPGFRNDFRSALKTVTKTAVSPPSTPVAGISDFE